MKAGTYNITMLGTWCIGGRLMLGLEQIPLFGNWNEFKGLQRSYIVTELYVYHFPLPKKM